MVLKTHEESHARRAGPKALAKKGSPRMWFALAAPPIAWFAALNGAYFFVAWACARRGGELVLHAITLGALLACIAAGLLALRLARDVGARGPADHDDRIQRARFLARLGLAGAAIFALAMITQWLAILVLDPCMPMPRSRFTPDAMAPAAVAPLASAPRR